MAKKKTARKITKRLGKTHHDPLNTPAMRIVVLFVIGASALLLIYKLFI